jgi:hypothetical protein
VAVAAQILAACGPETRQQRQHPQCRAGRAPGVGSMRADRSSSVEPARAETGTAGR